MKNSIVKLGIKRGLCAMIALLLIISLAACGTSGPIKEEYSGSENSSPSQTEDLIFGLNETAVFEDLKITATEIKESTGESFFAPENGNVFVGVKFTIENTSSEEKSISSILLFDAYADDISCSLSLSASAAFDGSTVDGTIAPGKKLVGWYTVEIPQGWSELELNVQDDWLSNNSATFVFTK